MGREQTFFDGVTAMVSLKDISAVCGVSVATVSKALNDHNDIGAETKERIRQVAKEMGYLPNSAAKALKTHRTHNIGVLFSDAGLLHDYYAYMLIGLKSIAEVKGYDITFINAHKTRQDRMSYLERSRYRGLDGIIIACIDFLSQDVLELVQSDIPVVTVDHLFNNVCAIMSDNVKGMSDLIHYIHGKGHRKVAYIHGGDSPETKTRLSAFYMTSAELGIDVPGEYIGMAPYRDTKAAYRETMRLLDLKERPTCIMYPDDFACIGGIDAIRERGLRVPEDISVAGYDGLQIGRHITPQLTTVERDPKMLGQKAVEKLIDLIERPKTTLVEQIVIAGKVYPGGTVSDLNHSK